MTILSACLENNKMRQKAKFTPEEDQLLITLVNKYGQNSWNAISAQMNGRNVRQCRERWRHYLSPQVSMEPWTNLEDFILMQKYAEFGPKWKNIAAYLPHRTEISVKNRFLLKQRRDQRLSSQIAEISNEYIKKIIDQRKIINMKIKNPAILGFQKNKTNYSNVDSRANSPLTGNIGLQVAEQKSTNEGQDESENELPFLFDSQDISLFDLDEDYLGLNQESLWVSDSI